MATVASVTLIWSLITTTFGPTGTLSVYTLFGGLWIVWTGLALSPCIFLYVSLDFLYHHTVGDRLPVTSPDIAALWLFALTLSQRWRSRPFRPSGSRWLLAVIVLLLASLSALSQLDVGGRSVWLGREFLGVTLVWALLLHHVCYQTASKHDAYWCGLVLTGLSLLATVAVAAMGLPDEPDRGVSATFLTYGYIPSIFLPIVVMPHYLAWQKLNVDGYQRMRERMSW